MNHCGHGRVQCSHRNLFDVPAGRGFFAIITGTHNYYYVFIFWFSENLMSTINAEKPPVQRKTNYD